MKHALTIFALMLSACAGTQDYPRLLPTDQILAPPALPAHARDAAADPAPLVSAASARADALRARAEALRGPVVDPALRKRAGG